MYVSAVCNSRIKFGKERVSWNQSAAASVHCDLIYDLGRVLEISAGSEYTEWEHCTSEHAFSMPTSATLFAEIPQAPLCLNKQYRFMSCRSGSVKTWDRVIPRVQSLNYRTHHHCPFLDTEANQNSPFKKTSSFGGIIARVFNHKHSRVID